MLATVRAPEPNKQKGRPVAGRPLKIHINTDTTGNSTRATQMARLAALCGVTGNRAELIATLVWGDVRNG